MENKYTIDDIETLTFKEGVRKRIAMYLGSADMNGVYAAIQEIISNAIDEYYMGYGKKITIALADGDPRGQKITIIDYGRGIPFGKKEDGSNVLVDIFSRAHTGGKFTDKAYNSVAGLNGIGAKATCLSSSHFAVITKRDNLGAHAIFEKGELVKYEEIPNINTSASTQIQFILDPEVYNLEPIKIDFDVLCAKCKNLSYLTKGLTFELEYFAPDTKAPRKVSYCATNGLLDLVKDNVKNPVHPTPVYLELSDGANQIEIAMQWTKDRENSYVFTNGLYNPEGGTSLTGMKMAITRFMKKQFKGEFDGDMARTGLFYAVSCKILNPSFANQTKTKINNPELNGLAQKATTSALEDFMNGSRSEFNQVIDFLAKERKAEEAADKARQAVLTHQKDFIEARKKKFINNKKLHDAEVLGEDSILLLVEGDSAAASIALARDTEKYGILGLKGKIINCLSSTIEEILENDEVKIFLLASGIDIMAYSAKKLRYGKIAICVDADDDGCHIACLIMALLQKLAPQFIKENRLYWLKAPLYRVEKGGEDYFFYDDEELAHSKIKGIQTRFKGLGQMDPDEAKASMFSKYQHLEPIIWSEEGVSLLEDLMGEDVGPRKQFVFREIDFEKYGEV